MFNTMYRFEVSKSDINALMYPFFVDRVVPIQEGQSQMQYSAYLPRTSK